MSDKMPRFVSCGEKIQRTLNHRVGSVDSFKSHKLKQLNGECNATIFTFCNKEVASITRSSAVMVSALSCNLWWCVMCCGG